MSSRPGEIIQGVEVTGYVEWNGTVDQLRSCQIWRTLNEVSEHWREGNWIECKCGGAHEDALLFDGYEHWPVQICLRCRVVITNRSTGEVNEVFVDCSTCGGEITQSCYNAGHTVVWPKPGHPIASRNSG